jgi:hypothetical protein
MFSSQLYAAKQAAWLRLSALAARQVELEGRIQPDAPATRGHQNAESAEAIARAFEKVREMRVVPFDLGNVWSLVGAAVGPMLPVLGAHFPFPKPLVEMLAEPRS